MIVQYKWKTIQGRHWDSVKAGWPWLLNQGGDGLIEVKIAVFKQKEFQDFDNWLLNTGRPINVVPLDTGSTVYKHATKGRQSFFIPKEIYLTVTELHCKNCHF